MHKYCHGFLELMKSMVGQEWRIVLLSRADGLLHADITDAIIGADYQERPIFQWDRRSAPTIPAVALAVAKSGIDLHASDIYSRVTTYDSTDSRAVHPADLSFFWKAYDVFAGHYKKEALARHPRKQAV
jgi:hypothetical protein